MSPTPQNKETSPRRHSGKLFAGIRDSSMGAGFRRRDGAGWIFFVGTFNEVAMTDRGVVHGRFQVLHNDHLKYILAGMARCRHLVVGITNPDPLLTRDDAADAHRSDPRANPLTYFERYELVRETLHEAGLDGSQFSVVPLPINLPSLYRYYVPLDAVFYLTIYDRWGRRKLEQFQALGLRTEVLWVRPIEEKGLSASGIRERMARGERWEMDLPPAAARLMKRWRIPERLRNIDEVSSSTEPAATDGSGMPSRTC